MAVKVNIEKNFRDFSLKVDFEGSSAAIGLLGASGSGKSMTLRCIAGIETPDKGRIVINGKTVFDSEKGINLKPQKRRIGYLFQNYALFPTMTVEQNIRCGYRGEKSSAREKVADLIRRYHLEGLEKRLPSQLSGGQQQRVALARMMIGEPEAILLDEPFSALDPLTRSSLQDELSDLHRKMGKTMIFVTHDMDEAIKIADRICIMKDGRILQYDTPEEILRRPANDFVANFVGANRIWGSPKYIRVEDFMIRHPVTCDASLSAERCITKLTMRHVDTLLVTGKEGQLLGIVNRKSLYANHRPDKPAGEIMLPPKCTAHPEDSILDVLKMIDQTDAGNVPVVDALGRVVGLLTNSNLVSTLSRQYLEDMTEEVRGND